MGGKQYFASSQPRDDIKKHYGWKMENDDDDS